MVIILSWENRVKKLPESEYTFVWGWQCWCRFCSFWNLIWLAHSKVVKKWQFPLPGLQGPLSAQFHLAWERSTNLCPIHNPEFVSARFRWTFSTHTCPLNIVYLPMMAFSVQCTKNKQCYQWDHKVHHSVFIEGNGFASQPIP